MLLWVLNLSFGGSPVGAGTFQECWTIHCNVVISED